jgi:hypothetical protein
MEKMIFSNVKNTANKINKILRTTGFIGSIKRIQKTTYIRNESWKYHP